jgi:neutral ceramidase
MPNLTVGIARANVTPPVGMVMSGYASRTEPARGIHDELNTVVLYFNDGQMEAALVTTDIISISAKGAGRIREACQAISGVPAQNIMVAFSHTHGGPQIDLSVSDSDDATKNAYATVVVQKIAGALSEAKSKAVPVRMGYGRQDCYFGKNRREHKPDGTIAIGFNPDGPVGHFTNVIRFDGAETGNPLAILFSYACHGTTMRANNLFYTADYIGPAKSFVDKQFSTALSAFVAFCSADIDPWPHGDFEKTERYGRQLGCAVVQAALDISNMKEDARIAMASQEFKMSLEAPPTLEQAKERLEKAKANADKEMNEKKALNWFTQRELKDAEALVQTLEKGEAELWLSGEIQALAIGDCAIVGMPGEIFVKIGLEIAEKSPFPLTMAIAHTNGSIGYVPTADQVPLGGYEIKNARARKYGIYIAPDSDRVLIEGSLAVLQECFDKLR